MLAAGFALLGTMAAGAGPVARRWARRKGLTGNLKALLLGKAQPQTAPAKVAVTYFAPTGKSAQAKQPPEAERAASSGIVFQVAVPKGTSTAIFRPEWDVA